MFANKMEFFPLSCANFSDDHTCVFGHGPSGRICRCTADLGGRVGYSALVQRYSIAVQWHSTLNTAVSEAS